jgi:hypothetical protein
MITESGSRESLANSQRHGDDPCHPTFEDDILSFLSQYPLELGVLRGEGGSDIGVVRYHSGGSMKLNACNLLLAHMVYL